MKDIRLKVSYLKGLVDGIELEDVRSQKLVTQIVKVLEDMADTIEDIKLTVDETQDYVECIDEDLGELEENFYTWDEDDDEDEYYDYDDFDDDDFDFDEDFDDDEFIEVDCPNCHETVYIDEDLVNEEGTTECPNCNTTIEFDVIEDEDN